MDTRPCAEGCGRTVNALDYGPGWVCRECHDRQFLSFNGIDAYKDRERDLAARRRAAIEQVLADDDDGDW